MCRGYLIKDLTISNLSPVVATSRDNFSKNETVEGSLKKIYNKTITIIEFKFITVSYSSKINKKNFHEITTKI